MQKIDPQGKHDPQPTPERELERYGVWVKAEPKDVIDDSTLDENSFESVPEGDIEALPLSGEEDRTLVAADQSSDSVSLDTLDTLETFDELPPLDELDSDLPESTSETAPDASLDEVSLDEFDIEDLPSNDLVPEETDQASVHDFETTEVNIEDFDLDASSDTPSLESMGEIEPSTPAKAESLAVPEAPADDFESLDIDLEFDDTLPAPSDDSQAIAQESNAGDSDFETIDLESIDEEAPDSSGAEVSSIDLSTETVPMDSFIDADDSAEMSVMPEVEMEDVSLDLSEPALTTRDETASDLMATIARELSSIKQELVSLRSQIGQLKADKAESVDTEPEARETVEDQPSGGFFDDEDDDTIALTGDELDNILNTADFTEEAASDESLPEDESLSVDLPSDIDLLPEDGDYAALPEQGVEAFGDDESAVESVPEAELSIDPEEGVTPLISAPSDTSFLDEEADSALGFDETPIEEAPLVEPNIDDLDLIVDSTFGNEEEELPIAEPAMEEVEIDTAAAPDELEPEIILDLPDDAVPVVSTVDAFPEAVQEIEELGSLEDFDTSSELGGVELHAEETEPSAAETAAEAAALAAEAAGLEVHPDDFSTSLDDSLFVESAVEAEDLPEETPELMEIIESDAEAEIETAAIEEMSSSLQEPSVPSAPAQAEPETPTLADSESVAPQAAVPDKLKQDVKSVLKYLDQLLASLPDEKIEEFASSEYYDTYRRLFDDLGLL